MGLPLSPKAFLARRNISSEAPRVNGKNRALACGGSAELFGEPCWVQKQLSGAPKVPPCFGEHFKPGAGQ
jgi:hypothetical protein